MPRKAAIAIVAPSSRFAPEMEARLTKLAVERFGPDAVELFVHPQCFKTSGHFAGTDAERADAFVEVANDPRFSSVWFARGGYGACRIAEAAIGQLGTAARAKSYLGFSDAGFLLAGLYGAGIGRLAHGPMPADIMREGGEAAVTRALSWLLDGAPETLEPSLAKGAPHAAFNMTVLSQLLGTPLQPALAGHVLMLEEVSEHMYRIDRTMFHITSNPDIRRVAGIRLGRCSLIPPNDPDFGMSALEVVQYWCARSGIPFLGGADIGHDADNRIVPFGAL